MAEDTKIEWTNHTFNPWVGCAKVSPACDHCYAEGWAKRGGMVQWGAHAERRRTSESNWKLPLKWNREAQRLGVRYRVFCASLADVFDNAVPAEWRADLIDLIAETPHLDWLLLTKRIGNAHQMLIYASNHASGWTALPNVWIGATICNQAEADRDIPKLLAVPAAKRFLSMEPLLGPVDLVQACAQSRWTDPDGVECVAMPRNLDWVIVGGESGHSARPMHPAWVRSIRDQCNAAGVAFFFKQHGEWIATDFFDDMAMISIKRTLYAGLDGSHHDGARGIDFFSGEEEVVWVGKKSAGRLLDGREWNEIPASL